MFDTIFQATFLSALLLYWLCIYHGVRQVGTDMSVCKLINVIMCRVPSDDSQLMAASSVLCVT